MQSLSIPFSTAEATPEATLSGPEASRAQALTPAAEFSSESVLTDSVLLQSAVLLNPADEACDQAPVWKPHLQVFTSTFLTIFLAELGDKTQVTTLLMAAESHSPWVVFAGAGAALIATSAIGVWLGCWLSKRVSPQLLERSVGILLLFVSTLLMWDVLQG